MVFIAKYISIFLGNNIIKYYNGKAWVSAMLPDGSYNIDNITLKSLIDRAKTSDNLIAWVSDNILLRASYSTLKAESTLEDGYIVDFRGDSEGFVHY